MSTIWTPSGERPIRKEEPVASPPSPPAGSRPAPPGGGAGREPTEEEMQAEMAAVQRELLETPAAVVVTNHCIGLFQLAALHLGQEQPRLSEAQLAIDALEGVIDRLGPRLAENEKPLRDALTQLELAFVEATKRAAGPS